MKKDTDKSRVGRFYDNFVFEQLNAGINHRHLRIQEYIERFGLEEAERVLEIGCGIGTQTELMLGFASNTCWITALDISTKSIEEAMKRLHKYRNVEFLCGDIIDLELEGNYDLVVLPDVLEHIPLEKHKSLFSKLKEVLSESGKILINIPHPLFLEYLIKKSPEQLQIIDQPIYLKRLSEILDECGLIINFVRSYSVYYKPMDYQFIMVQKANTEFKVVGNPQGETLSRRIKRWIKVKIKTFL